MHKSQKVSSLSPPETSRALLSLHPHKPGRANRTNPRGPHLLRAPLLRRLEIFKLNNEPLDPIFPLLAQLQVFSLLSSENYPWFQFGYREPFHLPVPKLTSVFEGTSLK